MTIFRVSVNTELKYASFLQQGLVINEYYLGI